jgi:CheY-like chemotaxis protein
VDCQQGVFSRPSQADRAMPGETILVAEDNAEEREGLALVLRQRGYTVRTARDGAEALRLLHTGPAPGLILLDMLMPGCDGWQFLDRRQPSPALTSVPVVLTTGLATANAEWAASLGAVGFLRKPFDVDALLGEVRRWLPA